MNRARYKEILDIVKENNYGEIFVDHLLEKSTITIKMLSLMYFGYSQGRSADGGIFNSLVKGFRQIIDKKKGEEAIKQLLNFACNTGLRHKLKENPTDDMLEAYYDYLTTAVIDTSGAYLAYQIERAMNSEDKIEMTKDTSDFCCYIFTSAACIDPEKTVELSRFLKQ